MALFLGEIRGEVAQWSRTADLLDRFQAELKEELSGMRPEERLAELHRCRETIREELQREEWYREAFRSSAERIAAVDGPESLALAVNEAYGHAADYFGIRHSVVAVHAVCSSIMDLAVQAALYHAERLLAATGRTAPAPWSWLACGDHGRRECSLNRELSGVLCWEGMADGATAYFSTLAGMATAMLLEAGFANRDALLPSNPSWRGSLDDWRNRLASSRWVAANPAFFADLRHLHGAPGPAVALIRLIRETQLSRDNGVRTRSRRRSLRELARIVASFPAGIDLFGRFRTEKSGPYRKRFNLGLYGIEPLVSSVRLLAICRETVGTGTVDRIRELQEKERLSVDLAERLLTSWHAFLRLQIANEAAGMPAEGSRFVEIGTLSAEEQQRLKAGLEAVEQLQMVVYQTLEPA